MCSLRCGALAALLVCLFLCTPVPVLPATASVPVSATVVSNGWCWFTTAGTTLDFGTLDPGNPVDVNASSVLRFRCIGFPSVTYYVSDDDGLNETGPNANRMAHGSLPGEYLPYSFDLSPRTATISWSPFVLRTLNVTGTVRGADYQGAAPGAYSDTVVLTIDP
ncbi:MAG: hypothetical protein Kow00128_14870 [Deltaproteobacteria bacterium]